MAKVAGSTVVKRIFMETRRGPSKDRLVGRLLRTHEPKKDSVNRT